MTRQARTHHNIANFGVAIRWQCVAGLCLAELHTLSCKQRTAKVRLRLSCAASAASTHAAAAVPSLPGEQVAVVFLHQPPNPVNKSRLQTKICSGEAGTYTTATRANAGLAAPLGWADTPRLAGRRNIIGRVAKPIRLTNLQNLQYGVRPEGPSFIVSWSVLLSASITSSVAASLPAPLAVMRAW